MLFDDFQAFCVNHNNRGYECIVFFVVGDINACDTRNRPKLILLDYKFR